jgi:lipopolysaccharide/colanic/teichoic acid biosynthesis glycosyltransferase
LRGHWQGRTVTFGTDVFGTDSVHEVEAYEAGPPDLGRDGRPARPARRERHGHPAKQPEPPSSAPGIVVHVPWLVCDPVNAGPGPIALRLKRWFDLVVAGILLVPAVPLGLLIAVLIKLTSRGPVLFWQVRVGMHGELFEIVKFRTMVRNADQLRVHLLGDSEADGLFKMRRDPRLTRIGTVLRQSYLDELPQLINVLRGEMSIVGPRPLVPDEDAAIRGSGRARLCVPPGMTGEWQLLRGGGASLDELIAMDYRYATEWSLWRDIRCVAKTVRRMIGSAGW